MGSVMQESRTQPHVSERCACCGALLPVGFGGVEAWRIGNQFVCNEFCADGIAEQLASRGAEITPKTGMHHRH